MNEWGSIVALSYVAAKEHLITMIWLMTKAYLESIAYLALDISLERPKGEVNTISQSRWQLEGRGRFGWLFKLR